MTTHDGADPAPDELRATTDSHTLIRGRRWRRTDPGLGDHVRQLLVNELMSARRAVKAALAADDENALRTARSRVDDAKVGLGERGPKWWSHMSDGEIRTRSQAARRALAVGSARELADDEVARELRLRS